MQQLPDGTPWWAAVLLLLLVLFVLPVYKIHAKQKQQGRETKEHLEKVDYQVNNNHSTNLRDDIDKAIALSHKSAEAAERIERAVGAVSETQSETARDVRTLAHRLDLAINQRHEDLRDIRAEMSGVNGRLTEHIEESLRATRDRGVMT